MLHPHVGAIVHYLDKDWDHKAAIVTTVSRINPDEVCLTIFGLEKPETVIGVLRGETTKTWHWVRECVHSVTA